MDYAHGFEPETAQLREHISGCPDCRKALDRINAEKELFREAAARLARIPVATRTRMDFNSGRMLTMAASILLCAGVSWMLLHSPADGPVQDVASKATAQNELPPGLRKALPGIEERLTGKPDAAWTREFLKASELNDQGLPKIAGLHKEDLSALVARGFRGAATLEDRKLVADRTGQWALRLTQFVSAGEAVQGVHGYVDVDSAPLEDVLGVILTKHGVGFVIDGIAKNQLPEGPVGMKANDMPAVSMLALLLQPRKMDFATVDGLVVITTRSRVWKATSEPPTPEEAKTVEFRLKDLVSSDAAKQEKAYDDLVTLGPPALGPLMAALGPLEGKPAQRVREVCRKIAWDHNNLWLAGLPSGADVQKLSGPQKKLLDTRITCETVSMELENYLKSLGLKYRIEAGPQAPLSASFTGESLSSFLKAATRPENLDFYLEGETIVIDHADNVKAVVER
jgi:hypothetical protein